MRCAAVAGVADAQAAFGQMLLDGDGVAQDHRAALGWFTRAAAQHHLMALNMVGRCYDLGWGTVPDKGRAAQCYRVAAQRGLAWAMYNYATLLALGDGVGEDRAAALQWLEAAVAAPDAGVVAAKALNFVGSFAEDGWVHQRDMVRAANCYRQAAAGGDFRGCFNHARMLAAIGNDDAALRWIARAGALGNPRFIAQVETWIATCASPALRRQGRAALHGERQC